MSENVSTVENARKIIRVPQSKKVSPAAEKTCFNSHGGVMAMDYQSAKASKDHKTKTIRGTSRAVVTTEDERYERWAELHGSDFAQDTSFLGVDLKCVDLQDRTFTNCDFSAADFSGALLKGSTFNNCKLDSALFTGCDLSEVMFNECSILFANFSGATIGHIIKSHLKGSIMWAADLQNADFGGSHLQIVKFRTSNMAGVDFSGAVDMTDADFRTYGEGVFEIADFPEEANIKFV